MKKVKIIAYNLSLAFIIMLINVNTTNAQELKIGYVDPQAILNRMPEMKAVQQRLKNFQDRKNLDLQNKAVSYEQAILTYEQKREVISAEARQTEEAQLEQMRQDLLQADQTAQAEIQAKRNELLGPLQIQISQAINAVAERMELSYVLNTVTSTGDFIILYASNDFSSKYNITDAVMVELGI